MKNNMKLLDQYLSYLREQKQYSEHTIDSYKRDIDMFFEFAKNEGYKSLTEKKI